MPQLKSLVPMLSVADLKRTKSFYCDGLGFRVASTFGTPDPVWCLLERDSVRLMFNFPGSDVEADLPKRAKDLQVYYFYPDDVTALHAEWTAKGVAVTELRVTSYGMRELEIRDPDGYWLWFGEGTGDAPTTTG